MRPLCSFCCKVHLGWGPIKNTFCIENPDVEPLPIYSTCTEVAQLHQGRLSTGTFHSSQYLQVRGSQRLWFTLYLTWEGCTLLCVTGEACHDDSWGREDNGDWREQSFILIWAKETSGTFLLTSRIYLLLERPWIFMFGYLCCWREISGVIGVFPSPDFFFYWLSWLKNEFLWGFPPLWGFPNS